MHEAHKEELVECEKQLVENKELVARLEVEGPERAQNFSLYQQMSGYVKDLVECLDLKVGYYLCAGLEKICYLPLINFLHLQQLMCSCFLLYYWNQFIYYV